MKKSIKFIIGQYVERKDLLGLADYFRAYLEDEALSKIKKLEKKCYNVAHDKRK